MNFRVVILFAALACTKLFAEDDPLDKLIVNSTRLKCSSGFAEVSYGYKPGATKATGKRLEFVVIQTNKWGSQFRSLFRLSSKVDDVTPPAYIGMEEHTVDLPNPVQLHAVGGGRYYQSHGDVTLDEVRAWLDQPDLDATIKSLLAFKSKMRQSGLGLAQKHVTQVARWIPTRPQKIVFASDGAAQILDDNSVQLDGSTRSQEFTLYFEFQKPTQIQEIRIELLPRTVSVNADPSDHRKKLVLFDVKPHVESRNGQRKSLNFSSCVYLGNPKDESTANCIDYLTDTGWTVPVFTRRVTSHQLVFGFAEPVHVDSDHRMALTLDSGGSPDLDVLTHLRVSFVATSDN